MLYHLLAPLGKKYILFNLFNYISFRAAGAMVTALLLAFLVGPGIIARLRARKVGQVIRAEGPGQPPGQARHADDGRLIILLATVIPTLLWARLDNRFVLVALLATLWMGGIGFLDDYLKIVQGKSRGLVARGSWWGSAPSASRSGSTCSTTTRWCRSTPSRPPPPRCRSSSTWWSTSRRWLYVAFVTFVVTGSSNAVNLTDGLDGLADRAHGDRGGGVRGLRLPLRPRRRDQLPLPLLPARRRGARRLLRRAHGRRASGSSGSTPTRPRCSWATPAASRSAARFGTVAILLKAEFLLLLIGGVFVAEAVSVMLQTVGVQVVQAHAGQGVRRRAPGVPHGAAAPPLREAGLGTRPRW